MSERTTRDAVWTQALVQLMSSDRLQRGDIGYTDGEEDTVRRTLNAMEEVGLLARDPDDERLRESGEMWHWLRRSTPGAAVEWDTDEEQLVLVEESN